VSFSFGNGSTSYSYDVKEKAVADNILYKTGGFKEVAKEMEWIDSDGNYDVDKIMEYWTPIKK